MCVSGAYAKLHVKICSNCKGVYLDGFAGAHAEAQGVGADHLHPGGSVAIHEGGIITAQASVVHQDVNACLVPPLHNDAWQSNDLRFLCDGNNSHESGTMQYSGELGHTIFM